MLISMKLFIGAVLITAIFVSSPLQAGDKDVVVVNTPDVNVINDGSSPVPVTVQNGVQNIVEWRYVGRTTYADDGSFDYGDLVGIAAMNKACADDFGPGARAATISEALHMDSLADVQNQWLVPAGSMTVLSPSEDMDSGSVIFAAFDAATGAQVGIIKPTPAGALAVAYCSRYQANISPRIAPTVTQEGEIGVASCQSSYPVACSAPVAIPVTTLP